MILKKGDVLTTKQLAEWFGLNYNYFCRKKISSQKYEELEYFCDFEKIFGGIKILEVYIDTYIKNYSDITIKNYLKEVYYSKSKRKEEPNKTLGTLSGITRKQEGWDDTRKDGVNQSAARKNRKARNTLFGNTPFCYKVEGEKGLIGLRTRVWAIKEDWKNNYRYLNETEQAVFETLTKEYYNNKEAEKQGELIADYRAGEISDEKFKQAIDNIHEDYYNKVVKRFKELAHTKLVRVDEYLIEKNKCSDKMIKEIQEEINKNKKEE